MPEPRVGSRRTSSLASPLPQFLPLPRPLPRQAAPKANAIPLRKAPIPTRAAPPTAPSSRRVQQQEIFYEFEDNNDNNCESSPPPPPPPQRRRHRQPPPPPLPPPPDTPPPHPYPAPVPTFLAPTRPVLTLFPKQPAASYLALGGADDEDDSDIEEPSHRNSLSRRLQALARGRGGAREISRIHFFGKAVRQALLQLRRLALLSLQRDEKQCGSCDLFERRQGLEAVCRLRGSQWRVQRAAAERKCLARWQKWALCETWVQHEGRQAIEHDCVVVRQRGWKSFSSRISQSAKQHRFLLAAGQLDREQKVVRTLRRLRQRLVAALRSNPPVLLRGSEASGRWAETSLVVCARRTMYCWLAHSRKAVAAFVTLFERVAAALETLALSKMRAALKFWTARLQASAERRAAARHLDAAHSKDRQSSCLSQWGFHVRRCRRQARCCRRGAKACSRRRLGQLFRHWATSALQASRSRQRAQDGERRRRREEAALHRAVLIEELGRDLARELAMSRAHIAWRAWKQACAITWFRLTCALKRGLQRWLAEHRSRFLGARFCLVAQAHHGTRLLLRGLVQLSINARHRRRRPHSETPPPRRRIIPSSYATISNPDYVSSSDSECSPDNARPPPRYANRLDLL